ncbi:MAG: hypothetical protein AAGJ87_05540 [Pseudomonadota bacterium]
MADHHDVPEHERDKPGWADDKGFQRAFVIGLAIAAILAALAGFVPAFQKDHPHFALEGVPVFFAVYGFAAFIFIVLVGQHLRKLVGREERYYDDRE